MTIVIPKSTHTIGNLIQSLMYNKDARLQEARTAGGGAEETAACGCRRLPEERRRRRRLPEGASAERTGRRGGGPKPPGEAEATLPEPPFTPATYSCGDTPPRRSRLRTQGTSSEAVVGGRSGGDAVRETVRPSWKAEGGTDGVWRQCKCGHGDGKHANRNLWFGAGRQEMALEQQPQTFANTCTCEDTGYTRVEGNRRAPRNGRWAISHR
jgi:hypothetical protein